jgi:sterol desaturase/sphingolipid hydroxylase (fatty acid hydroxylase superfamily)
MQIDFTSPITIIVLLGATVLIIWLVTQFISSQRKRDFAAEETTTRHVIANTVILSSLAGILILSALIIYISDTSINERARLVFNAVLPLLATWVGVVLAFFFNSSASVSWARRCV